MDLTPKQLEEQSKIKIDYWIEFSSERCKEIDDNYALTKKIIRGLFLQEPAYLFADSLGRLYGKGSDNLYYPFHFSYRGKLVGYRISTKAAN